jgi:outer membrane protein assembly factor BamC
MQKAIVLTLVATSVLLLPACSITPNLNDYLPDQRLQYKKQREASENLEIPPDLTSGSFDDAMDVPPVGGTATYSEYQGERSKRSRIASSGDVLPEVKDVKLRREGNNRWLVIKASPQEVWPKVIGFWRSQGILLVEQDPTTGIMKTDWLENRADIRRDFITNMLRKVADGLYATALRDQYRVRIEPGLEPGTTDLYLTHRAMEERFRSNAVGEDVSTVWEPAPPDPDKEAAMLRRLLVYLGVSEKQVSGLAAQQQQATSGTRSQLTQGPGGESVLVISDELRNAWRLTGVALDRIGFAVEDRDRTQGIYYVRYDDPSKGSEKKGWTSKLAFWRSDDAKSVAQYQVKLMSDGDRTRVVVRDQVGRPASSATAERILRLLNEQIR